MDDAQIAEEVRVCKAAARGPCAWQKFGKEWCLTGQYGMRPIILATRKGHITNVVDGLLVPIAPDHPDSVFIAHAYGNAEGTTGYAAALEEVATGRREFAVIRNAYLVLLKGVQDWVGNTNSCMALPGDLDNGCGECPQCDLAVLVANTAPAAPPFAEEKDKEREQLEKDAAAYRVLLEAGKDWLSRNRIRHYCGDSSTCSHCILAALIDSAEPGLPHSCENGKRQGAEKRERLKDLCRAEHRKLT